MNVVFQIDCLVINIFQLRDTNLFRLFANFIGEHSMARHICSVR